MSNSAYHFWRIIAFSFLCAVFLTLTGCGGGDSDSEYVEPPCTDCGKIVENNRIIPIPVICENGACK